MAPTGGRIGGFGCFGAWQPASFAGSGLNGAGTTPVRRICDGERPAEITLSGVWWEVAATRQPLDEKGVSDTLAVALGARWDGEKLGLRSEVFRDQAIGAYMGGIGWL